MIYQGMMMLDWTWGDVDAVLIAIWRADGIAIEWYGLAVGYTVWVVYMLMAWDKG